jgi:hypothetical protein
VARLHDPYDRYWQLGATDSMARVRHLFLSSHTVAFHLRRIFCKLDLVSRAQLASLAADTRPGLRTDPRTSHAGDASRIAAREAWCLVYTGRPRGGDGR